MLSWGGGRGRVQLLEENNICLGRKYLEQHQGLFDLECKMTACSFLVSDGTPDSKAF